MTLEQIKNRQERINESLYSLLSNTNRIVISITGNDGVAEEIPDAKEPYGFLEEVSMHQDRTEVLLNRMVNVIRLLHESTYAPNEVECPTVKGY